MNNQSNNNEHSESNNRSNNKSNERSNERSKERSNERNQDRNQDRRRYSNRGNGRPNGQANRRRSNGKQGTVLFYPTGIVHFRNLQILKKILPHFKFRVIVEEWVKERAMEFFYDTAAENRVMVEKGHLPTNLLDDDVDVLFMSMAYPNPFRLRLVDEATKRNIPVVSIEEVNQLALNNGIINHYFLPIDHLGVPSGTEKDKFMELGVSREAVMVTGWPFFDREAVRRRSREHNIRLQYKVPQDRKCCLLVLGALKERDMVSLETRKIREEILDIVAMGLSEEYQLFVKPHPIEASADLDYIKKKIPGTIILPAKHPIEPLLADADLIVNRGNSQVILLALLQNKPVIVVPQGLPTIFHGVMDPIIADSAVQFRRLVGSYTKGKKEDNQRLLKIHFPFNQDQAWSRVRRLFQEAMQSRQETGNQKGKKSYLSILYAFLGEMDRANAALEELKGLKTPTLLKKLYAGRIHPQDFRRLLRLTPGKVARWHLQALFIRAQYKKGPDPKHTDDIIELLKDFDGDVNPHYFIDDIFKRIELEYILGNDTAAEALIEKFQDDYSGFDFYRQAFEMFEYVYRGRQGGHAFRKFMWVMKNFTKPFARHCIKQKIMG